MENTRFSRNISMLIVFTITFLLFCQTAPVRADWLDGAKQQIQQQFDQGKQQIQQQFDQGKQQIQQKIDDASRNYQQQQVQNQIEMQQHAEDFKRNMQLDLQQAGNRLPYSFQDAISRFQNNYQYQQQNTYQDHSALNTIFRQDPNQYSNILSQNDALRQYEIQQAQYTINQQVDQLQAKQSVIWRDYDKDAWNVVADSSQRELVATFSDPEKVSELDRNRGFITEGTILAIKIIPIYDSSKDKVVTMDQVSKEIVSTIPALSGSDISKDPVRAGSLAILKTNYLLYGNLIHAPDGSWISVEEAATLGYKTDEIKSAKVLIKGITLAANTGDASEIEQNINRLGEIIDEINYQKESPKAFDARETYPLFAPVLVPIYNAVDKPNTNGENFVSFSQQLEDERRNPTTTEDSQSLIAPAISSGQITEPQTMGSETKPNSSYLPFTLLRTNIFNEKNYEVSDFHLSGISKIGAYIRNDDQNPKSYILLVEIQDMDGNIVGPLHYGKPGTLMPSETMYTFTSDKINLNPGLYAINIYIWESIDTPNAITQPAHLEITVLPPHLEQRNSSN